MWKRLCERFLAALHAPDGYSLTEVTVATSLLVAVLIPLSGVDIYLLTIHQNESYLAALAIGQQAMEETLHTRTYDSKSIWLDEHRWLLEKKIKQQDNQITITVRVFRQHRPQPMVELMTVRLLN